MTERFWEQYQGDVELLANEIVKLSEDYDEWLGPGGVKLKGDEAMQRYLEVTADPNLRAEVLAQAQIEDDLEPNQIPRRFFKSIKAMNKRFTEKAGS